VPSLRQQFIVTWDDGEPVTVRTTVEDLINAVDRIPDESVNNRIALNTQLIYSALERLGHNPPPYNEWINVLDNYEETTVVTGVEGPTQPVLLRTEPLSSDASPEPTGEVGSTEIPAL
jgi:hypothetical protein